MALVEKRYIALIFTICLIMFIIILAFFEKNYNISELNLFNSDKYHINDPKQTTKWNQELNDSDDHSKSTILGKNVVNLNEPDWVQKIFSFIPFGLRFCPQLFPNETLPQRFSEKVNELNRVLDETIEGGYVEGHSALKVEHQLLNLRLVRSPFVKTVCETGFNAGHSSLAWLEGNPNVSVYAFDIGHHKYSRKLAKYLGDIYSMRFHVIWGDSMITLPQFHKDNPDVKCDLIIIDGGHTTEVAQADFDNFKLMVNPSHILMLDDYPSPRWIDMEQALGEVWEHAKQRGDIIEILRCTFGDNGDGLSVGRYSSQALVSFKH